MEEKYIYFLYNSNVLLLLNLESTRTQRTLFSGVSSSRFSISSSSPAPLHSTTILQNSFVMLDTGLGFLAPWLSIPWILFPGWVHELGQTKVPALMERSGCAPGQHSRGCSSLLGGDLGTWPGSSPAGKSFQGHRQPVVAVWAPFLRERSWNSLSCVVYLHLLLLCLLVWHFPLVLCLTSQFLMFLSQPEWQIPVPDLQPLLLGFVGDLGPLSVQNSPVLPQVRTECCESYFAI